MRNSDYLDELLQTYSKLTPQQKLAMAHQMAAELPTAAASASGTPNAFRPDMMAGSVMDKQSDDDMSMIAPHHLAAVKVLGTSSEDAVDYLHRQYPDLKFGYGADGEIKWANAKPGKDQDDAWHPISNTGGEAINKVAAAFSDPNPISAAAAALPVGGRAAIGAVRPTLEGIGQAGGSIAGAITAAATGNPEFVWPAASAGGAIGQGGVNAVLQGLGRVFGVNKGFDENSVLKSAAWGATAPLFGTGVSPLAAPIVGENALEQMAATVARQQRIPIADVMTWDKSKILKAAGNTLQYGGLVPGVTSGIGGGFKTGINLLTGTKPETLDYAVENGGLLSRPGVAFAPNQQAIDPDVADPLMNTIMGAAKGQKAAAKDAMDAAQKNVLVPTDPVRAALWQRLQDLGTKRTAVAGTAAEDQYAKQQVNVLKQIMNLGTQEEAGGIPGHLTGDQYGSMIEEANHDINPSKMTSLPPPSPGKSRAAMQTGLTGSATKQALSDAATTPLPTDPPHIAAAKLALRDARDQYGKMANDLTMVDQNAAGSTDNDFSNLKASVGNKSDNYDQLREWAQRTMSDSDYKDFLEQSNALGANMDYNYAKGSVYAPHGMIQEAGAGPTMAMKGVTARGLFNVAAPVYGTSSAIKQGMQAIAPYASGFSQASGYTPFWANNGPQAQTQSSDYQQQLDGGTEQQITPTIADLIKKLGAKK